MMKSRTVAVACLLAITLAVAPVTPAFAWGRHGGGHYGGGPIVGFVGAVVGITAAIITAPIAILASVAQTPFYYPQGPAYGGSPPVYYNTPPPGPGYDGNAVAPAYSYGAPQPAPYYARSPAQSQGEWYYCADSKSYYPYVRECPAGWQRVPAQPPGADYDPR